MKIYGSIINAFSTFPFSGGHSLDPIPSWL